MNDPGESIKLEKEQITQMPMLGLKIPHIPVAQLHITDK